MTPESVGVYCAYKHGYCYSMVWDLYEQYFKCTEDRCLLRDIDEDKGDDAE